MKSRLCGQLLLLLLFPFSAFCQDTRPLLALLPIRASSVSTSDTSRIAELVERSIIDSGRFTVVEQRQVRKLLEDQGIQLVECSDEKCAVALGRVLRVNYILLAALTYTRDMYVCDAAIIDVTEGSAVKSQKLGTDSLLQMAELVGVLTQKLTESLGGSGGPPAGRVDSISRLQQPDLRLTQLLAEKRALDELIGKIKIQRKRKSLWAVVASVVGGAAVAFVGYGWYAGDLAYNNYLGATITEDVVRYREQVKTWDTLTYVSGGVGLVGLGLSTVLWLTRPKIDQEMVSAVERLELEIRNAERSPR